jgi:hypothetical protein
MQADNSFLVDEKQHAYSYDAEDTTLFYGTPDKRYYLDDYTRFTTMEEVMREYVIEVRVRKDADHFNYKIFNGLTKTYNDNDPLVLFDGLQREREFYSPVYNTEEQIKNHLPDVRNVLYWSPNIKTGSDGKTSVTFYTSDIPGKFACVLQGITAGGLAGSNIVTFDVTK